MAIALLKIAMCLVAFYLGCRYGRGGWKPYY